MPKPTDPATWAGDTTYTGGPEDGFDTKTVPAEGETQGWRPGAEPPAEEFNYWQNLVGQWTEYLDAGAMEGDWSFAGNVTVAVSKVVSAAGGDVKLGVGSDGTGTGGSISVDARVICGDVKLLSDRVRNIPGSAAIAIKDADTNAVGVGEINYPSSGYVGAIQTAQTTNYAIALHWPIPFDVGDRVKSVTWRISGNGSVDIVSADIGYVDSAGVEHSLGTTSATNVSGSLQDLTVNITDHTLAAGEMFFVSILTGNTMTNGAGLKVYSVQVTYDRPAA